MALVVAVVAVQLPQGGTPTSSGPQIAGAAATPFQVEPQDLAVARFEGGALTISRRNVTEACPAPAVECAAEAVSERGVRIQAGPPSQLAYDAAGSRLAITADDVRGEAIFVVEFPAVDRGPSATPGGATGTETTGPSETSSAKEGAAPGEQTVPPPATTLSGETSPPGTETASADPEGSTPASEPSTDVGSAEPSSEPSAEPSSEPSSEPSEDSTETAIPSEAPDASASGEGAPTPEPTESSSPGETEDTPETTVPSEDPTATPEPHESDPGESLTTPSTETPDGESTEDPGPSDSAEPVGPSPSSEGTPEASDPPVPTAEPTEDGIASAAPTSAEPSEPSASAPGTPAPPESGPPAVAEATPLPPSAIPSPAPGGARRILSGVISVGAPPAWSPDGSMLAFSAMPSDLSRGPDIYVWREGEPTARPVTRDHQSYFASWARDRIVVSRVLQPAGGDDGSDTSIRVSTVLLDPADGRERMLDAPDVWLPAVDPDGERAIFWLGELRELGNRVQASEGQLYEGDWGETGGGADGGLGSGAARLDIPGNADVSDWHALWAEDGAAAGIWVARFPGARSGQLTVLPVSTDGSLEIETPLLNSTSARRGFSLGHDRVAWVPVDEQGRRGSLRLRTWGGGEGYGDVTFAEVELGEGLPGF